MGASNIHNGWRYDVTNSRLDFYFRGTRVGHIDANGMELATGDLEINAGTVNAQDGGTVTQSTNKTTGVTLSTNSGQITMNGAALADNAEATFVVTNTTVAATDVVAVCHGSAGTAGAYNVGANSIGAGSFAITVGNVSGGALSEAIVIHFVVLKGASS
tara:strand:- start:2535 stop:3011 length:477 start_codon:yes stop_codon:yes gene_type:complete